MLGWIILLLVAWLGWSRPLDRQSIVTIIGAAVVMTALGIAFAHGNPRFTEADLAARITPAALAFNLAVKSAVVGVVYMLGYGARRVMRR